jgi:hypothetical protein
MSRLKSTGSAEADGAVAAASVKAIRAERVGQRRRIDIVIIKWAGQSLAITGRRMRRKLFGQIALA